MPERRPGLWGAFVGVARRTFRKIEALKGVSFTIEEGELVGYIGPNGAGKSTTIKVISGILNPDSGRCEIDGLVPWADRVAHVKRIGVVFGQRTQLWWDLPVIESFDLLRDIYGVDAAEYEKTRNELVERLNFESLLNTPVRLLSLGQRMRCDLVAALLHKPSILFLDEPTVGLDSVSKLAFRDFIREINKDQKLTIILTTHDMDDIEALCNRVIVIGNGEILSDGPLEKLRKEIAPERLLIVDFVEENAQISDVGARVVDHSGHRAKFSFNPEEISASDLIARVTAEHPVRDLFVENPPIEEIIAQMYSENSL
ncbi:ABC transporter ATP-binding protein [Candidatus Lucifugimonas marina]|uniref:ABC transporter ATP-binding protein n=1 Tax=Candidatus Lucifugimonas marina TaxID=3038979 RepID=UPI00319D991A